MQGLSEEAQAQSAEEIAARDALHDAKEKARAGRRAAADCDDKKKKKKKKGDDSDSEDDSGASSDEMFEAEPEEESEEEEEPEEKSKKPKNLMDQLGVQLDGAVNLNVAAKSEKKPVSAKRLDMDADTDKPELTRKEREALEAQRKAAAYRKKHEAGETDEAKADLARLAEVRRKRAEAKERRDAEAEGGKETEKVAAKKVDKNAKVELPTPTQKEVKSSLLKLKDCAEDDFQKKWKLTGLSGNKLSKMKYSEFMKIWEDFVENGSDASHREYVA